MLRSKEHPDKPVNLEVTCGSSLITINNHEWQRQDGSVSFASLLPGEPFFPFNANVEKEKENDAQRVLSNADKVRSKKCLAIALPASVSLRLSSSVL